MLPSLEHLDGLKVLKGEDYFIKLYTYHSTLWAMELKGITQSIINEVISKRDDCGSNIKFVYLLALLHSFTKIPHLFGIKVSTLSEFNFIYENIYTFNYPINDRDINDYIVTVPEKAPQFANGFQEDKPTGYKEEVIGNYLKDFPNDYFPSISYAALIKYTGIVVSIFVDDVQETDWFVFNDREHNILHLVITIAKGSLNIFNPKVTVYHECEEAPKTTMRIYYTSELPNYNFVAFPFSVRVCCFLETCCPCCLTFPHEPGCTTSNCTCCHNILVIAFRGCDKIYVFDSAQIVPIDELILTDKIGSESLYEEKIQSNFNFDCTFYCGGAICCLFDNYSQWPSIRNVAGFKIACPLRDIIKVKELITPDQDVIFRWYSDLSMFQKPCVCLIRAIGFPFRTYNAINVP